MTKILIKNVEVSGTEIGKIFNIGITDHYIDYIGESLPLGYEQAEVVDGYDKIAVPGLVNAHTHAAMTLLRSYADDMVLMDWLQKKIWPAEANLTDEDIYNGSLLAIAEMLKSGTTCFADMYFSMERVAQAVEETGIRAVLARGLVGTTPDADEKLENNKALYRNWHGKADGRITVMLGPHAPYTCPQEYMKKIIMAAEELGAEIHMHLAETAGEVTTCREKHGMTPIAFMESLGLFEHGTLAAHCVHVSEADLEIMAKRRVRVAHNPQSNLKLASGIAPVPAMLARGIIVGLGTDGASSNNNLDILEEVRLAALLHKNNTGDPLVLPADEALALGTKGGALALGLSNLGEIKAGQLADLVLYSMKEPYWYPRNDRTSLLVYAANATDADTVIVNGKLLMQKRELLTIDEEKVYHDAEQSCRRLINR